MGVQSFVARILPQVSQDVKISDLNSFFDKRNSVRIGVDVSMWIARAIHGNGAMLLDERRLTNHGRSELMFERDNNKLSSNLKLRMEHEFVSRCCSFVMSKIKFLQGNSNGQIIVVFDGATPPVKREMCMKRRERRENASSVLNRELEDVKEGEESQDLKAARRAGLINPVMYQAMAGNLINQLRQESISFLVAPYEADGQLAFMSKHNLVDVVITEDSDMIGYGIPNTLFKIDDGCNSGLLVRRSRIGACDNPCLLDFSDAMLAVVFAAAGCDYCNSLRGIGFVKAANIVKSAFHSPIGNERIIPPLARVLQSIFAQTWDTSVLRDRDKESYEKQFLSAVLIYRQAIIYNPIEKSCLFLGNKDPELCSYPPYAHMFSNKNKMESVLGEVLDSATCKGIVEGTICPKTRQRRC